MGKLDKLKSQIPQGSQELSTKNHLAKTEIAMSFQNEGTELTRILLRNIEFNPHNLWSCNDDDESIQQLADAIERNGLLHNIVVSQREDGTFMLLSGERRVKALRLLQKREQESDPTGQKAHKWDRVQAQTYTGLDELSELEKENATDIDRVSGCFGRIMAEIFAYREDVWEPTLHRMGFYLGKFIYLMDAYDDVEDDVKKGNYNPFAKDYIIKGFDDRIKNMLLLMMAETCREFEKLPIIKYADILRNILYSGVWCRFESISRKRREEREKEDV